VIPQVTASPGRHAAAHDLSVSDQPSPEDPRKKERSVAPPRARRPATPQLMRAPCPFPQSHQGVRAAPQPHSSVTPDARHAARKPDGQLLLRLQIANPTRRFPPAGPSVPRCPLRMPALDQQAGRHSSRNVTAESAACAVDLFEAYSGRLRVSNFVPIVTRRRQCFAARDYAQSFGLSGSLPVIVRAFPRRNPQLLRCVRRERLDSGVLAATLNALRWAMNAN